MIGSWGEVEPEQPVSRITNRNFGAVERADRPARRRLVSSLFRRTGACNRTDTGEMISKPQVERQGEVSLKRWLRAQEYHPIFYGLTEQEGRDGFDEAGIGWILNVLRIQVSRS
jgi:hypothetical protein